MIDTWQVKDPRAKKTISLSSSSIRFQFHKNFRFSLYLSFFFFFLSPKSLQPPDQQRHQDHGFPEKNGKKEDLILRKKSRKCFPSNLFTRDCSMFGWFSSTHFLVCPVISLQKRGCTRQYIYGLKSCRTQILINPINCH